MEVMVLQEEGVMAVLVRIFKSKLFWAALLLLGAAALFFIGKAQVQAYMKSGFIGLFRSVIKAEIVDSRQLMMDEMQRQFLILDNRNKNLAQALVQITSKISDIEKDVPELVKAAVEKTGAEISASGKITGRSGFFRNLEGQADHVYPLLPDNTPDRENENYQVAFKLSRGSGDQKIAVGWIIYYPNQGRVKRIALPVEFDANIVEAEQKTGQTARYVELWARSPNDKETRNNRLPLEVKKAEWIEKKAQGSQFFLWNPNFHLGAGYSLGDGAFGVAADLGCVTYGRTKEATHWRFLSPGAAFLDDEVVPYVSLVDFNWAEYVPVLKHAYIGVGATIKGVDFGFNDSAGISPFFKLSVEF